MLILFLLRRLSARTRLTVGLTLTVVGLVGVVVAAAVATNLLIHGVVATLLGVIFLASGWRARQQEGLAVPQRSGNRPALADWVANR